MSSTGAIETGDVSDLAAVGRDPDDVRRVLRYAFSTWCLMLLMGGPAFSDGTATAVNELSVVTAVPFAASVVALCRVAPVRVRGAVRLLAALGLAAPAVSVLAYRWVDDHPGVDIAVHPLVLAALGVFGLAAARWFRGDGFGRAPDLWRRSALATLAAHVAYAAHLVASARDLGSSVVFGLSAIVAALILAAIAWGAMAADATRHGLVTAEVAHHRRVHADLGRTPPPGLTGLRRPRTGPGPPAEVESE
jgi:hypothetical protein